MRYTGIVLDERLQLSISSYSDSGSKSVRVELNRIGAQALAHALLQFAGAATKSARLGRSIGIPCLDLDPPPEPRPARPVKLGSAKRGGPIYLKG